MTVVFLLNKAGTQKLGTYVYRGQTTLVEWVVVRTIYVVCDGETYYEGERRRHETSEGYIRRDFGGGKGTVTGFWQAWRG